LNLSLKIPYYPVSAAFKLAFEVDFNAMGEPLSVPISIDAYDSRGSLIDYLPVPVYFETTYGSVEPSDMALTSGGLRIGRGYFLNVGAFGVWWPSTEYSSTTAWRRTIGYANGNVSRDINTDKDYSFSVRCVRD